MIKVLVLIDYSTAFSRSLLEGLIEYSQEVGNMIFYRLPLYYKAIYGEEGVLSWAKEWKADFIIVQWNYISFDSLKKIQIPIFLQDYKEEGKCFSNITGDYIGMGALAANFFIQRRFKNFAFYGKKGFLWSSERAEGFRSEIEKVKGNYYYFENEGLNEGELISNIQLEDWLKLLPKPIAIFACDDSFAILISEMCKLNNIRIPDEIALLGVDNDRLICNLSDPPISSIVLDANRGGYELGKRIQKIINENVRDSFNISIPPIRIELRKSTEKYNINDKCILEVIKYIQNNFRTKINIPQLIELVPLSRRSLEIKFKHEMGLSIYQFIINLKIEHFTLLLMTTNLSIPEIVFQSGFNDYSNVYRIFKSLHGCTPAEYRQKIKNINCS